MFLKKENTTLEKSDVHLQAVKSRVNKNVLS